MADISILQLPPTSYVQADDVTVVVQQGITKKVAASVFQGGITGPTGPAGPQGPAGVAGPVGPQGPQGPQGVVGPTGPQGVPGQTGAPGPTGPIGPQGSVGQTGAPGPTGPSGPAGATGATGPKGDTGAQGPQGIQGPQGVKGDKGDTGNTGAAATIAVGTTTTSAPGGAAAVSNSGTSSAAVFDFTIPRGDTGPAGATGAGVATGGTTGQVLAKASNTNYDTSWINLVGGLNYQGNWNASANTPTLTSSVGTNGYYYTVSVAGSTNLNGITDWQVGDWAIFNGTVWQKIDQTNTVSSVNGQVGAVVLGYADVGAPSTSGTNATGTWGISVTGNAGTVTNGVYTTGSYADPSWLTSLATTKLSGTITNAQLANSAVTINGNSVSLGGSTTITAVNPFALTIGSGLSGTSYNGSSAVTITNSSPMTYPASGIPSSTGSAWNSSYSTIGSGSVLALDTGATLNSLIVSDYETFTAASAPTYTSGRLWYDTTLKALSYNNDVTNNTLHIGQETQLKVYNNTGSTIAKGAPVYITSTTSGFTYPLIALAKADTQTTGACIGLTNEAIATGSAGYVVINGILNGVNTGTFTVGDILYVSPYSAGQLMNTYPPTAYAVKIGTVAYVNSSNGSIYVNQSNAYVVSNGIIGTVDIAKGGTNGTATPTAGAVPYGTGTAYAFTAAGTTGQVLTSNGAGAPTWTTPTTGTVTSVSGTTGRITSTGGSTPVIDLASGVATAGTTGSTTIIPVVTIDTYGRVTSITTAANPQGTVTSVSGTGTVNGLTLTGTVTTSGNLTLGGTLDLSSPPAIGATAPNTIKGTTGTFTSGISGGTF